MIYWNPNELAASLRENRLDERSRYRLLLVGSVFQLLFSRSSTTSLRNVGDLLMLAVTGTILVWGVNMSYRANQRGDGQRFIERYICLGVALTAMATETLAGRPGNPDPGVCTA